MANLVFEAQAETDLQEAAQALVGLTRQEPVVGFYGDMGVGKTTLIKVFCKLVGVSEDTSSPTFALVNEYLGADGPIFHFDFYRIENESEALDMGYEDYFCSGNLCLVEWPEKIAGLMPDNHIRVEMENRQGVRIINIAQ